MQIAFYGTTRHIGTSANMAAVAAGFRHYLKLPVITESFSEHMGLQTEKTVLFDCGRNPCADDIIKICDLLVLNISIPDRELEKVYERYFLVRKNVIFLIGKYYQDQLNELERLARMYRLELSRICEIPYHPGFGEAYENKKVLNYLKNRPKDRESYADFVFEKKLRRAVSTIITYADRKGENYYG